jgi:predicted naringenin-chalcone synthase
MEIAMTAIGTANPEYKKTQMETAELICAFMDLKPLEKRLIKSVYKASGIQYRHSVLSDYVKQPHEFTFFPKNALAPFPSTADRMAVYKEHALHLGLAAIKNCFDCLIDFDHHTITHLITVSCTGMYAPGIDIEIVHHLQLNSNTQRTAIHFMGCYGAFNAIKIADSICRADPNATVLLVCVELCSIHFQKNMALDNIISNSIFADGAAAALVQANKNHKKYFCLDSFYCDLLPQTSQAMAWTIANNGFDIVLSSHLPELIQSGIFNFTEKLFRSNKFHLSDIDFFAIHPGGLKILQACEKALAISEEENKYSYHVLRHFGNMSSPTILFVLKEIWNTITLKDQEKTIFGCAFGPGLTLESMILKVRMYIPVAPEF